MTQARIRSWIYLAASLAAFVISITIGSSILYLFGGNLGWFFAIATAFLAGAIARHLFPPTSDRVLDEILLTMQDMMDSHYQQEVDDGAIEVDVLPNYPHRPPTSAQPIVAYYPHPPIEAHNYDYYLVVSRSKDGEAEDVYLSSLTRKQTYLTYDSSAAYRFPDLYTAWLHCWVLYVQEKLQEKYEVFGVKN